MTASCWRTRTSVSALAVTSLYAVVESELVHNMWQPLEVLHLLQIALTDVATHSLSYTPALNYYLTTSHRSGDRSRVVAVCLPRW